MMKLEKYMNMPGKIIAFAMMLAGLMFYAPARASVLDSLEVANGYYKEGKYDQAILLYSGMIDSGVVATNIYYNLGNAYYKTGNIPMAIVNYERAKRLSPNDEDIEHNLELARLSVVDEIEVLPEFFLKKVYKRLVFLASSNKWAIVSMITFVLGLVGFFIFLVFKPVIMRKITFWSGIVLLIVSIIAFFFSYSSKNMLYGVQEAVITAPNVTVKSEPGMFGTDLFILHEGTKGTVVGEEGEWVEIKLSDGNTGWMKKEALVII